MNRYIYRTLLAFAYFALTANMAVGATDTLSSYLHYGSFEVKMPFFADTTDVNSKKFDAKSLLPQLLNTDALAGKGERVATDAAGSITLTTDTLGYRAGLLTFYIDASRFCKASMNISGIKSTEIYLNGAKQERKADLVELTLEPKRHEVVIKYLTEPGKGNRLTTTINCATENALSMTLDPTKRYTIDEVLNGRRISSVSLSPDGKFMLTNYSETFPGGKRTAYLQLTDRVKGDSKRIDGRSFSWMPQGHRLYYMRNGSAGRELVAVDPATLGEQILARGVPASSFTLSADERFLFFSETDKGPVDKGNVKQILEPDDRMPGWRNRSFIYRYSIETGVTERLTFGHKSTHIQNISDDGRHLLFSTPGDDFSEAPFSRLSLFMMDLDNMNVDTIFFHDKSIGSAIFSPDGSKLLVRAGADAFDGIGLDLAVGQVSNKYNGQLFLYDLATKSAKALTKKFDPAIKSSVWSRFDNQIYLTAENGDRVSLYTIDPANGQIKTVPTSEDVVQSFSLSKKTPELAYYGLGLSNSHRLYSLDLRRGRETLIDDVSQETLKDVELGQAGDWNFTSSGDDLIHGRYYYPVDFDANKRYPMVVYYYGGTNPTARRMDGGYSPHVFAGLGYVVYVIQPSGTTGYGQQFAARHVNAWGKKTADEIIEGTLKFCEEHPFVDKARIGCVGASYGGFMTMYLQTVTDIFAAAISHAGISNISAYWGEGYWGHAYSSIASAGSYPWNAEWLYAGQSPLYSADKINTPLLLLHGTVDTNVPTGQSMQMFVALKALGKEVSLVLVEGENHGIAEYGNRIKWNNTMYAWFGRWLKDEPEWWESLYPQKNL